MIRLATCSELRVPSDTEMAVRLLSVAAAYGDNQNVVRFYTDEQGAYMSVMDGVAVFYSPTAITEEWIQFLSFVPQVRSVRADVASGRAIAAYFNTTAKTGVLMCYRGDKPHRVDVDSDGRPDALYPLLASSFPSMPPFDVWYVDVSHRIRHGLCHVAFVQHEGIPISCAMTVAETEETVILGAVATDPGYRRQGFAGRCVLSLVERFWGRRICIAPVDEAAQRLYSHLGFVPCHTWAEVVL